MSGSVDDEETLPERSQAAPAEADTFESPEPELAPIPGNVTVPHLNGPELDGPSVPAEQIEGRIPIQDGFLAWTSGGDIARSVDGTEWFRDEVLSDPNVRTFGLFEYDGVIRMVGTWEFRQDDLVAGSFFLGNQFVRAPDGSIVGPRGFTPDRSRPDLVLGSRSSTTVLLASSGPTTVVVTTDVDGPVVQLSSELGVHKINLDNRQQPRSVVFTNEAVVIRLQEGAFEIDPETGSVTLLSSLSLTRETNQ